MVYSAALTHLRRGGCWKCIDRLLNASSIIKVFWPVCGQRRSMHRLLSLTSVSSLSRHTHFVYAVCVCVCRCVNFWYSATAANRQPRHLAALDAERKEKKNFSSENAKSHGCCCCCCCCSVIFLISWSGSRSLVLLLLSETGTNGQRGGADISFGCCRPRYLRGNNNSKRDATTTTTKNPRHFQDFPLTAL